MPNAPKPIYLMAGGPGSRRSEGDPLLKRILASSGVPHPSVAYVGAANGDSKPFTLMMAGYMRLSGAGDVIAAPTVSKRARLDKTQAILEAADLVFMSGGDVEAGMQVLQERQLLPFLRSLYEAGKPFFGVSAGSIMLAREWVRWPDPNDDASAELFPCMGLASVLCDTHGEADGWEELQAMLRLQPEGTRAYGIPSGGGLCVTPDGAVEALALPLHVYAHQDSKVMRVADMPPNR
jgi:hypothetical protein